MSEQQEMHSQRPGKVACNICSSEDFVEYAGRAGERCGSCGALARHRVALEVYARSGVLTKRFSPPHGLRILQLAPEGVLFEKIRPVAEGGYICADSRPEAYGSLQCIRLVLPAGLDIFPQGYFDYILHNHVLEHLPGSFRDHIGQMVKLLKPSGKMIFSVPGPDMLRPETEEGGENLLSDAARLEAFGQVDHFKRFGRDLLEFLDVMPGGRFERDNLTDDDRAKISVKPMSNRFLIWQRQT